MEETPRVKGLLSTAIWINRVLLFGCLLVVAVIVAKSFKASEIEMSNIKIPVEYSWVALSAFTVVHFYLMVVFLQQSARLYRREYENARGTWEELTNNGPAIFRNMVPRYFTGQGPARMHWTDPTAWGIHIAAILLFVSQLNLVPFIKTLNSAGFLPALWQLFSIGALLAALGLTVSNWYIGSQWAIAASELNRDRGKSGYFNRLAKIFGQDN